MFGDFSFPPKNAPPALQEAEAERYRLACLIRCLEASLDRIQPDDFDELMARLQSAREQLQACAYRIIDLRLEYMHERAEVMKEETP